MTGWHKPMDTTSDGKINMVFLPQVCRCEHGEKYRKPMFLADDATAEQLGEYSMAVMRAEAENDALLAAARLLKAHGYTVTFNHKK